MYYKWEKYCHTTSEKYPKHSKAHTKLNNQKTEMNRGVVTKNLVCALHLSQASL